MRWLALGYIIGVSSGEGDNTARRICTHVGEGKSFWVGGRVSCPSGCVRKARLVLSWREGSFTAASGFWKARRHVHVTFAIGSAALVPSQSARLSKKY
jgi:hypothetical protein